MDAPEKRRWYRPTPGWLVPGSLAVTGLLWLSSWLNWPAWHKGYAVLAAVAGVGVVLAVMLLWWLAALAFRWRFQFSLRTMLVFTLAVAFPCSWLAAEMKSANDRREAIQKLNSDDYVLVHGQFSDVKGYRIWRIQSPPPRWLQSLFGPDFFEEVYSIRLPEKTTDDDLALLRNFCELKELEMLKRTKISDAGLVNIARLKELEDLTLNTDDVTDAGMGCLARLPKIHRLSLISARITDDGLNRLHHLTSLEEVYLINTNTSDHGVECLRQALPNCVICCSKTL